MPPIRSFLLSLSLLLLFFGAAASMSMPGPRMALSPHVLSECGCNPVITNFLGCQNLTKGSPDCVCQNSWYGNSTSCLSCLTLADDPLNLPCSNDFFGNFRQVLMNVFAACTTTGGSVSTNGSAVCGRGAGGDACVYFNPMAGGESWATRQDSGTGTTLTGFFALHLGKVPGINDTQPIVSTNATTYPSGIPLTSTSHYTPSPTSSAPGYCTNGTSPGGYGSPAPGASNSSIPVSNSASPLEARGRLWAPTFVVVVVGAVAAAAFS